MTSLDPYALFAPPILTIVAIVLGYAQSRRIRGGKALSSFQKKLMFYMPVFVLGMGYAIMFQDKLAALFHWENAWIAVMVAWGVLLAGIAWTRHRRAVHARAPQDEA